MDLQTMNTTNVPQEMEFFCFDKIQKEAYKLHQFTQPNNDEFIHQVSYFQFRIIFLLKSNNIENCVMLLFGNNNINN